MKKIFFIPIIFAFISCNSIKVKEMGLDSTQDLVGKIKQIEITKFYYPINENDTIVSKVFINIFYDEKNRKIKQIDDYQKFVTITDYNYKNDLLQNYIIRNDKSITKVEYKYDKKNNIIEYNQYSNDTLYLRKTSIYDYRNNPLETKYYFPNNKKRNSVVKFNYNYKKRNVIIQNYDENDKPKNSFMKTYFNKKGNIIKTEFISSSSKNGYSSSSIIEYDKLGNLTKRTNYNKNGEIIESTESKNTYDYKGNIIIREKYLKGKLIEKKTYKITYK